MVWCGAGLRHTRTRAWGRCCAPHGGVWRLRTHHTAAIAIFFRFSHEAAPNDHFSFDYELRRKEIIVV